MVKIIREGVIPPKEVNPRIGQFECPYCTAVFDLFQDDLKFNLYELSQERRPNGAKHLKGRCFYCKEWQEFIERKSPLEERITF